MSFNEDTPLVPVPPPNPTPPRHGCLTAIMLLVGVVLLLPGLCAGFFMASALATPHFDTGLTGFIVVGLLVGFGGILLIRAGIRGPRG